MIDNFDELLMDRDQAEHAKRLLGLWNTHGPLLREQHELRGGMIWKKARGHEYSFRYFQDAATGTKKFVSQGRRSPETEAEQARYFERRSAVQTKLDGMEREVEMAGRMAQAFKIARMPATPARIVHGLWLEGFFDDRLKLMGATAIHAYELASGFLAPPSLFRGESLRILIRDDIDDDVADAVIRLTQDADRAFELVERDEVRLVMDGGRGGRIEVHVMHSLVGYLMDRGLDPDRFYDLLTAVAEPPAWRGAAVARDARIVPMATLDPRAHAMLTYATALTEKDEVRAELLLARARLIRWVAEERLGLGFTPRQVAVFPDLWDGPDAEDDRRRLAI